MTSTKKQKIKNDLACPKCESGNEIDKKLNEYLVLFKDRMIDILNNKEDYTHG